MERTGLITLVKVKMDEYTPAGVSLPFDQTIGPLLDEAAVDLLKIAPIHHITPIEIPLEEGSPATSIVEYDDDKAYIPVPSDYIRLYAMRYPAWKVTVREAVSEAGTQYKATENEYLTPGNGRPQVAIVHKALSGSLKKYFECGRVEDPDGDTLTPTALYVKKYKPEELNDIFADALSWLTASKVFGVLGYEDKAKSTNDKFLAALAVLA